MATHGSEAIFGHFPVFKKFSDHSSFKIQAFKSKNLQLNTESFSDCLNSQFKYIRVKNFTPGKVESF